MTLSNRPEEQSQVSTFSFEGAKLAPSEVVLLYGDRFMSSTDDRGAAEEKLLRTDRGVPAHHLSRTAWSPAVVRSSR